MDYQKSLFDATPAIEKPIAKEKEVKQKDFEGFEKRAREIGEMVLAMENPLIVHHFDCDGLSSGSIVRLARKLSGKPYEGLVLKKLGDDEIAALPESKEYVFVDLGSGYADKLAAALKGRIVIIDHHPPVRVEGIEQINAHDFGFDGGIACSAASTAAYCFKHLDERRIYQLGIVGAVGDVQDADGGFKDLNARLLAEAKEKEFVLVRKDLRLFGKMSRPLAQFLNYCSEPILPGLTGSAKNCAIFLENAGIPVKQGETYIAYYDLSEEDRKKFVSALVEYALAKGLPEKVVQEMVGDVYLFPWEETRVLKEAYEFSTLLNACGRHEQAELGVRVCLNEEGIAEAEALLLQHRMEISKGIYFSQENVIDLGEFYFLDGRGKITDSIIGSVIGAFLGSGVVLANKPVLGFSLDEKGRTKVSGRGNKTLVQQGLDLGQVMHDAGEVVDGVGGGHKPAAGCTFETSKENDSKFLMKAKDVLKKQLTH